MAARKKKSSTSVVPSTGRNVAGWADRMKKAAERQQKSVGFLGGGSRWISFKGGVITVDGASAPAGKFLCVVLGYMQTRTFYEGEYDGNNPQSPDCYAYGDEEGRPPVAPHEEAVSKQSETCADCEWSQFGTAERGRGQRCRQHVRLALVPATEEGISGEPYFAHIPPTSIKFVKGWLEQLDDTPCFAAVTEISVTPSAGNMFDVKMRATEPLPTQFQEGVLAILDRAEAKLREPYPEMDAEPAPKKAVNKFAAKKKTGKKKPAAKKRSKF